MMRVLLVDDERLARAELRRLLAPHEQVEIVGEAANAAEAILQIAALQPDLVLLDVQMPGGSGFDMLEALDVTPEVIFTTAFDQYALRAFEVNALDYLQKPIQAARLAAALERAAMRLGRPDAAKLRPARTEGGPRKIFIKDGERCWLVDVRQIRLFESEGNYTRVYFEENKPLMLRSLNQLEEKLDGGRFFRANRRHIVNLDHVQETRAADGGGMHLLLHDGVNVEVSRRRAVLLREQCEL